MTLTSTSVDDIGVYNLKMLIGQDISNSAHGFDRPYRGVVETVSYDFTVTVNPCLITSYNLEEFISDYEMTLGDP